MFPSVVSREIISAVRRQLSAQFPSTTDGFGSTDGSSAIDQLLQRPDEVFKGPYLSFGLPFRTAPEDEVLPFRNISFGFSPYLHQMRAFKRLTGAAPQPTLVATGTGSGKTECFMYPLLDHCAANSARGVKALIIYPMNALAQDQARRFAKEIYEQENLKGKVSVGLYTGDGGTGGTTGMSAKAVITNRGTQQENPPDILLTNYKMLDFLLLRPRDRKLWRYNDPGTLRYLVVDELHTFDGAQGTDLACLVRRLRDRLGCGDELACVGTSATVGDDIDALTAYASNVFDTRFREDSVLREERLTPAEFLSNNEGAGQELNLAEQWPAAERVARLHDSGAAQSGQWLAQASELWFEDAGLIENPVSLGEALMHLPAFEDLLELACDITDKRLVAERWRQRWALPVEPAQTAIDALVSLVAHSRSVQGKGTAPLVTVREQLWLRELRRMVATVSDRPRLVFRDDLTADSVDSENDSVNTSVITLPVVHCNVCHATGWVSRREIGKSELVRNIKSIYDTFFNGGLDTVVLYPAKDLPATRQYITYFLCNQCGVTNSRDQAKQGCSSCGATGEGLIELVKPEMNRDHVSNGVPVPRFHNDCPYCESVSSLFILGSRAATLSAVAIDQLFNSQFNDDAKLIAFSDSVQDAAHRAGFFGARTYRDVVRTALAHSVQSGTYKNLEQLCSDFASEWRKRMRSSAHGDADFVATFLAPDLVWLRDWDALQQNDQLPADSTVAEDWISRRLEWEALIAFGFQSRSGRSLERTRASICYVDSSLVGEWAASVLVELQQEIVELRGITQTGLEQFLTGLLWRMRTRGGFFHPLLSGYLYSGGDPYQLRRRNFQLFLPPVGSKSSLPAFLSLRSVKGRAGRRFDSVFSTRGDSWYQHWFNRILAIDENFLASASMEQAYNIILRAGCNSGLLEEHEFHDQAIWALKIRHWHLSDDVAELGCNECGNRVQAPVQQLEEWINLACLRSGCKGSLEKINVGQPENYTLRREEPVRLVPAEHSAVLDSDTRAQTEESFKRQPPNSWDINLLSATPTMEMGVDIGDLSSVLLCSVPPAQANYLQRIGRAGRRDGNAFNLTIANGASHDLYFYAEPLEMMRGSVQPPGVFLDAIAVLERQLLAYCMDRWVQTDIPDDAIPQKLRDVMDAVDLGNEKQFPHNFLAFVDRERGALIRDFQNLFQPLVRNRRDSADSKLFRGLSAGGVSRLSEFLYGRVEEGGGGSRQITSQLIELFENKAAQRKRFRRDIDQLKRQIEQVEKLPADEAREATLSDLSGERGALQRLVRGVNRTDTLNFLTDEGVLPNYAFPEDGVTLNSVIYRRRETKQSDDDNTIEWENIELEIRRPAHAALRELAPHSRFYGNKRQVQIDQVLIDSDSVQDWRFCARCNYGESLLRTDSHSVCPRCGDAGWSAAEQRMTLLRLREVYANASDRDSRIGDDSDDREPVFYTRQSLFDMEPDNIVRGWRMTEPQCPFGFEFLSSANFREINFGRELDGGDSISVAGDTKSRAGFHVCKHCGKVRMWRPGGRDNHTRRCKMHGEEEEVQKLPENLWSALYLFRELQSEAVRILLPMAAVVDSDQRLQSFIAALHLGLKKHFRGNVDHLQITHVSEPVTNSQLRRHYLVLFDSVPGGTGYLDDLTRAPETMLSLLQEALDVLEQCGCQHNERTDDGCYRCLYAYRDSHNMDKTSRRSAIETLKFILGHSSTLESLNDGERLDHTEVNKLFDSELERLFIDRLSGLRNASIDRHRMGSKEGYILNLDLGGIGAENKRNIRWSIEPQVDLNSSDGVYAPCRPDFVLRCLSRSASEVRPVAIFADGLEHHRFSQSEDTLKRASIIHSGQFMVWTLFWNDLAEVDHPAEYSLGSWFDQPTAEGKSSVNMIYKQIAAVLELPAYGNQPDTCSEASLVQLLDYLREPESTKEIWQKWSVSRIFGLAGSDPKSQTIQQIGTWLPVPWQEKHLIDDGLVGNEVLEGYPSVASAVVVKKKALDQFSEHAVSGQKKSLPKSLAMSACLQLDDSNPDHPGFGEGLQKFWAASNMLQFAPNYLPVCRSGIEAQVYAPMLEFYLQSGPIAVAESAEAFANSEETNEALEMTVYPESLQALLAQNVALPIVGEDVQKGDEVIAMLEWQWPDIKVGFADEANDKEQADLAAAGWRVVVGCTSEDISQLVEWIGGNGA